MNIDDIKNTWNESDHDKDRELSIEKMNKKASGPLAKIKRSLLIEIVLIFSFFVAIPFLIQSVERTSITRLVVFVTGVITFLNFALFLVYVLRVYRKFPDAQNPVFKHVKEFVWNMKLNIELYRVFNYIMMPLALILGLCISGTKMIDHLYSGYLEGTILTWHWVIGGIIFIAVLLSAYWFTNYYVKQMYGRHLKELQEALDEAE